MNNHQKGYYRDNAIIKKLEEWGVLDIEQIQHLFFSNTSQRMAQKRLQKLSTLGKIQRQRDYCGRYFYYVESKPRQNEHRIGLNWVRIWLNSNLKSWEKMYCWQYEPNYNIIRPDALVAIKNTVTAKQRFYFIERECDTNPVKKVTLYNDFYSQAGYSGCWWAEKTDRFPAILIFVESKARADSVRKLIEKENKHGLEFKVHILQNVISGLKERDALCGGE